MWSDDHVSDLFFSKCRTLFIQYLLYNSKKWKNNITKKNTYMATSTATSTATSIITSIIMSIIMSITMSTDTVCGNS